MDVLFDETVAAITDALQKHRFDILTKNSIRITLQKKLNID